MNDTNRLDGKIALVTGATGEIGTATVRLLAQRGAAVVALDLPGSDFTALAGDLGDAFAWTEADVSDEPSLAAAIASVISRHGHIDVLFNNAGVEGPVVPIVGHDLADFRKVMAVNVEGVFLAMKYVLPGMIARRSGAIINASSIAGLCGTAGLAAYTASKHAVIGLTRVAAMEAAAHGVRVNCINPGPIAGRMIRKLDAETGIDPVFRASLIPAQHYGTPGDVAALVAFLASDDARYINASVHSIDGGLHAIA